MISMNVYPQLGNALFQIATAEALAKRNDDNAEISSFKHSELFNYQPNKTEITPNFLWKENHFHYSEIQYMERLQLEGYFQSEKYFKDEEEYIREIFEIDDEYKFEKKQDTCSLHVRRGDYLRMQEFHPVLSTEYYYTAMLTLEDEIGFTPQYIVFSDDPEWCRNNFRDDKFQVRDRMYSRGDWFDFSEQISCNYHIIANSTFSWWAAWLAQSDLVIAPDPHKRWFGPYYQHYNMKDLIPQEWKTV